MLASISQWLDAWDWRTERIVAARAVAEAALAWLLVYALFGAGDPEPPVSAIVVVGVFLVASLAPRILNVLAVWPPWYQIISLALASLTMAVVVKLVAFPDHSWTDPAWLDGTRKSLILRPSAAQASVWVIILLVGLVWWWGQLRTEPGIDSTQAAFRWGALALALIATVALLTGAVTNTAVVGAATGFFAASLFAIGWARQAVVHPGERSLAGGIPGLATALGVLVTLVVGLLLAGLASRDLLDTILLVVSPIWVVIRLLLQGVAYIVGGIVYLIFWPVMWLLERRDPAEQAAQPILRGTPAPLIVDDGGATTTIEVPDTIRYVIAAIILVVAASLLVRFSLRRLCRSTPTDDVEQHVEFDLRAMLRGVRKLGRRAGHPVPTDPLEPLRGDPRWVNTVIIRETYGRFLAWSQTRGAGRAPAETARHHAERVAHEAAPNPEAVQRLTEIYHRTRYGSRPATAAEARAAQDAWHSINPNGNDAPR